MSDLDQFAVVATEPSTAPPPESAFPPPPGVTVLPLLAGLGGVVVVLGLCVWMVRWDPEPMAPAGRPAVASSAASKTSGPCLTADESRRLWAAVPGLADAVRARPPDRVVSDDSTGVCRRELFYTDRGLRVVIEEQSDGSFRVLGATGLAGDSDHYLPAAEVVRRLAE